MVGCQDCIGYVVGAKAEQRTAVDGVILQAPVSDREALEEHLPKAFLDEANQLALKMYVSMRKTSFVYYFPLVTHTFARNCFARK